MILVGAGTLLDGDPLNNFLCRSLTFNPNGLLCGARYITFVGTYGYVVCDAGVVVVDFADPAKPEVKKVIGKEWVHDATTVQVQFRYAYVADKEGVKVFDITDPANPRPVSKIEVHDVHNMYLGRTYAYLAAGKNGLVILDIENPEVPKIDQVFTANGSINDLHDVKLAITYNSEFAYLADGKNGMRIVQLTLAGDPGQRRLHRASAPRTNRHLQDSAVWRGGGDQQGSGPRPSRGRERQSASASSVSVGGRPFNPRGDAAGCICATRRCGRSGDDPAWPNLLPDEVRCVGDAIRTGKSRADGEIPIGPCSLSGCVVTAGGVHKQPTLLFRQGAATSFFIWD